MKKLTKKMGIIAGSAVLVVGLMALPALADTSQTQGNGWFGQMQSFMSQTFTPAQHQQIMNSSAMQNLHNSSDMQNAMQTGDVKKMQGLMNANPAVKAEIGQQNLDKMNQFMNSQQGNMMGSGNAMGRK